MSIGGAFNQFTFKVIIEMSVLILLFWICFNRPFFSLFLFCSLMIWCLSSVFCFDSFFFFVCKLVTDFWFVTFRFWYSRLYIYIYNHFKVVSISNTFKYLAFVPSSYHDYSFWYHICMWIVSCLYCILAYTSELFHNFSWLLIVVFCFPLRNSLVLVVKLDCWYESF